VISGVLGKRLLVQVGGEKGYLPDPAIDDNTRRHLAQFYADLGFHKLATMMRKDPQRFEDLEHEGGVVLLGPRFERMHSHFLKARAMRAH
jgi:hypothetical protein